MRRALLVALVAAVAAGLPWPAAAGAAAAPPGPPPLVNEELVTSTLDLSGLPSQSTLTSRLVAHDIPMTTVSDPTSTTGIHYLDRPGAPPASNGVAQLTVGGPGTSSVLTGATFDKPLPVALHVEYTRQSQVLDPATVTGTSGEVRVQYTVTNTAVTTAPITYSDSAGRRDTEDVPVFAPFAGTLVATLDRDVALVSAPGAQVSTTADGATALLWNLVLAPPLGSYQQTLDLTMRGGALQVPAVAMQVMPTTTSQDPSAAFASDLLDSSVTGNTSLTTGLTTLDASARSLANGAGDLEQGLTDLDAATWNLSGQVSGPLVDGSRQIATGTSQLAEGTSSIATGVTGSATGAAALDSGLTSLVAGLRSVDAGLGQLAASTGLPAAQAASVTLQKSVKTIADAVGSPDDPPVANPPPVNITLIQAVRSAAKGSQGAEDASAQIAAKLTTAATSLAAASTDLTTSVAAATSAATNAAALHAAVCGATPTLSPGQCATLQGVQASAAAAASSAGSAAVEVGSARQDVGQARAGSLGLAAALGVLTASLGKIEGGLEQVSLSLLSGERDSPGVYEGLAQLSAALATSVVAVTSLATGSSQSLTAAQSLDTGAATLSSGLSTAATGADALTTQSTRLASGAAQQAEGTSDVAGALVFLGGATLDASRGGASLATSADMLQTDGTAKVRTDVVDSSVKPAQAQSYLTATDARAADALPYGAPQGAIGRVAYVATLTPPPVPHGGAAATGLLGVVLLAALAMLGAARVRRVRAARG